MQEDHIFGRRVLELRIGKNLSQKQLGEVIGLSHKAVSTIESGTRGTTVDKVILLAQFFHVSTDYLLGITDDPAWRGN